MTGQVPPSRCSPSVPSCSQRAQHYLPQPFQKPPEAPVEAFLPGVPDDKQYMDQCCSVLAPPRRICTPSAANRQPTAHIVMRLIGDQPPIGEAAPRKYLFTVNSTVHRPVPPSSAAGDVGMSGRDWFLRPESRPFPLRY